MPNKLIGVAQFKLDNLFRITNRGIVLGGHILDGTVAKENSIYLECDGERKIIKIQGVDFGQTQEDSFVGLFTDVENHLSLPEIQELIGTVLNIIL